MVGHSELNVAARHGAVMVGARAAQLVVIYEAVYTSILGSQDRGQVAVG